MAIDKVHMTSDGILVVNGQEYLESKSINKKIDGIEHLDRVTYAKFDRKDFNKKVKFIAKKIDESINKGELLKELIQKKGVHEIDKLYDLFKGTKKRKITLQKGCLGLKIDSGKPKSGGRYLQLID